MAGPVPVPCRKVAELQRQPGMALPPLALLPPLDIGEGAAIQAEGAEKRGEQREERPAQEGRAEPSRYAEYKGTRRATPDDLTSQIDRIFEVQSDGMDLVLFQPLRFGIGYGLPSKQESQLPDRRIAYWGGWGGSIVLNDVDRGFTFAYVMNRLGFHLWSDPRELALRQALFRDVLGVRPQK